MRALSVSLAALAALAAFATAAGHAEPARVKPGDGAVLTSAPGQVEIIMTQELARRAGANDIDVYDAGAREVTTVAAVIDNADRRRLTVPLPIALAPGVYRVAWKTLSAEDGDSAEGSLSFTFDPSGQASPGKETLQESLLGSGGAPTGSDPAPAPVLEGSSDGVTWVLAAAVGLAALVIGSGGTFLLIQKKP